ncbi:MAG: DUF2892 domain-containing protein [bacterium]
MKNLLKKCLFILIIFVFLPTLAFAHQPRIVESRQTIVLNPEVSKAYYGKLTGVPDVYIINSSVSFNLYVNILVPDIIGQKRDISVVILKDGRELMKLDGVNFEWKKFYEPFGADTYWMGPEYRAKVDAGSYEVHVSNPGNDSKYSLAIGEIEAFGMKEGISSLTLIPEIKKNFFNESPISFIKSSLGWGLILSLYILAIIVGFAYRFILKRFARGTMRGVNKNIGKNDRLVRFALGIVLLLLAVTTTWSPILIFFSGFCFFEAIFSWCGFYAALGKNTCPI